MNVKHKNDHLGNPQLGCLGEEAGGKISPLHRKGPQRRGWLSVRKLLCCCSPESSLLPGERQLRPDNAEALGLRHPALLPPSSTRD